MKVLVLYLFFPIVCFSQSKIEMNLNIGGLTGLGGKYQMDTFGEGYGSASYDIEINNKSSFHANANALYDFKNYLKAGVGIEYSSVDRNNFITPSIVFKLIYPENYFRPYFKSSVGLNIVGVKKSMNNIDYGIGATVGGGFLYLIKGAFNINIEGAFKYLNVSYETAPNNINANAPIFYPKRKYNYTGFTFTLGINFPI